MAVGTVHTSTLCIVTLALGIAAALGWWGAEPASVRGPATLLLGTALTLSAYTALQCLPLPMFLLRLLAPYNAGVWDRALFPLGERGPGFASLSLDPVASRAEVLKGTAYILTFVNALRIARRRRGVQYLSAVLAVTGIALAIAALLHPAFGAHKLYGFWEPAGQYDRHLAPLLNANNLASYLNVALCLALGMTLAPEPWLPKVVTGAAVMLLAGTQIWVASRAGVVTMVLGAGIVIVISLLARSAGARPIATGALLVGIAFGAGLVMVVVGGSEDVSGELLDADVSKVQLVREALRMLPHVPLFGVGRGAFETAFPAFRTTVGHTIVAHPENVLVEWTLTWGLPVTAVAAAAIVFALRPHAVLVRSSSAAGAWAAVIVVAIQNLVDLGSELAGLMLAPTICAAIVAGGSAGRRPRWAAQKWASSPRSVAIAAGALSAIVAAWTAPSLKQSADADRRAMQALAISDRAPISTVHAAARAAMLRHPGEPYLPFSVGLRAAWVRDETAFPWLGASLERSPVYGPAHLVLARLVASRSPSQARLEYRLALEQAPETRDVVMEEAPRAVQDYYDAIELVPAGHEGVAVLDRLVQALALRLPSTSARLNAELRVAAPTMPAPWLRSASANVDDLEAGSSAPWCMGDGRQDCVARALAEASHAEILAPHLCLPYGLHARAEIEAGNAMGALSTLSGVVDTVTDRVQCLELIVALSYRLHDVRRAEDTLGRVLSAGCSRDADCADNYEWIASTAEEHGNPQKALMLLKRAYERAPERDSLLVAIARLAASTGLHAEAAETYERLSRLHPEDPRWVPAAARERSAAVKEVVNL